MKASTSRNGRTSNQYFKATPYRNKHTIARKIIGIQTVIRKRDIASFMGILVCVSHYQVRQIGTTAVLIAAPAPPLPPAPPPIVTLGGRRTGFSPLFPLMLRRRREYHFLNSPCSDRTASEWGAGPKTISSRGGSATRPPAPAGPPAGTRTSRRNAPAPSNIYGACHTGFPPALFSGHPAISEPSDPLG